MSADVEPLLAAVRVFSRLTAADRHQLAQVARVSHYERGDVVFREGDPSDAFITIATGRVKVFKMTPAGKDVILEIFGPGDPLGAVAVYEGWPFPASALALEDTTAIVIPRRDFFELIERYPSLARGLLASLTMRLIELTNRLAELTGGRLEPRFARLFLKMADDLGRPAGSTVTIPMALSRQELADMTGTTIETCIRIMSRWGKQDIVRTEKDSFVIVDRRALEILAAS
ncbi:MAG: Crp/Fnr family transcriptional regulator [Vicinamibacterales bacterium]